MAKGGEKIGRCKARIGPSAAILIGTLTIMLAELSLPMVALLVYDRIIPYQSGDTLFLLIGVGAAIAFAEAMLRLAREALLAHRSTLRRRRAMQAATQKFFNASPAVISQRPAAKLISMLWGVRGRAAYGPEDLIVVYAKAAFLSVYIGVIAIIAGWLALAPIIGVACIFFINEYGSRLLKPRMRTRAETDEVRFAFLLETLDSVEALKAYGAEARVAATYAEHKYRSSAATRSVGMAGTLVFDAAASISTAMTLSMITIGAALALSGALTMGALVSTLILSSRLSLPVQRILAHRSRQREARARDASILEDKEFASSCVGTPARVGPNDGAFRLEAVSLKGADGQPILENASFDVEPGELILLEGVDETASQSVLELMIGSRAPDSGKVFVNGVNVAHLRIEDLSEQVGFLQRNPVVYRGSILDNLTAFGRHSASDALFVAELLGLNESVSRLPAGYDTRLTGADADAIPEGMRQQITLVRRLASRPRLILYDYADTALDQEGTEALIDLFRRLRGRATVVLATRDQAKASLATRRIDLSPHTALHSAETAAA